MYLGGVQAARRVTRSVRDPPRYSVAPAGVSDPLGLHLVELPKQALLVESIYAFLLGHQAPTSQKHRFHLCFLTFSSETMQKTSMPHIPGLLRRPFHALGCSHT